MKAPSRANVIQLAAICVFALIWQLLSINTNPVILPSFVSVASALLSVIRLAAIPELPHALGITLFEIAAGFAISAVLAFLLAVALTLNRTLRSAYYPLILFLFAIPHIVLFPLFIVTFGLGPFSKVAYGAFAGFPLMVLGMLASFTRVERSAIALARSMGAGTRMVFTKVVLPSSLSGIFSTLRVGLGTVAVVTVVAEVIGSTDGLGYYLRTEFEVFQTSDYFALVIVIGAVVLLVNYSFTVLERKLGGPSRR
jgi:ABC-type nitrate/sulfonate/bicarbonate transport system permease component